MVLLQWLLWSNFLASIRILATFPLILKNFTLLLIFKKLGPRVSYLHKLTPSFLIQLFPTKMKPFSPSSHLRLLPKSLKRKWKKLCRKKF